MLERWYLYLQRSKSYRRGPSPREKARVKKKILTDSIELTFTSRLQFCKKLNLKVILRLANLVTIVGSVTNPLKQKLYL